MLLRWKSSCLFSYSREVFSKKEMIFGHSWKIYVLIQTNISEMHMCSHVVQTEWGLFIYIRMIRGGHMYTKNPCLKEKGAPRLPRPPERPFPKPAALWRFKERGSGMVYELLVLSQLRQSPLGICNHFPFMLVQRGLVILSAVEILGGKCHMIKETRNLK